MILYESVNVIAASRRQRKIKLQHKKRQDLLPFYYFPVLVILLFRGQFRFIHLDIAVRPLFHKTQEII